MVAAMETKQRAADHAAYLERKAKRESKATMANGTAQQNHQKSKATMAKGTAQQKNQQPAVGSAQHGVRHGGTVKARGAKSGNGLKASGVTKVEPTPAKPAGRLQSDVVLRLDMSGGVIRER